MSHGFEVWVVIVFALLAANLPFVNEGVLTFAFPGFIWRYLRRQPEAPTQHG